MMNTFYSILQVPLRVEAGEKLSIGLLLREGDQVFFRYSKMKLKLIKSLIPRNSYTLLRHSLKDMDRMFEGNTKLGPFHFQLKDSPNPGDNFSSKEYISYLSRYNNNLLTFSPPSSFLLKASPSVFSNLYQKMVGDEEEVPESMGKSQELSTYLHENLYPKIKAHVNLDVELNTTHLPSLFLPLRVDFIGKNDAPIVGKEIDFSKSHYYLENDLTKLYTLVKAFEESGEEKGKYYAIGKEPSLETPKNHGIWQTILRSTSVDFVDFQEVDKIIAFIDQHGVTPYLPE